MKKVGSLIGLTAVIYFISLQLTIGQGCVAIRGAGGMSCGMSGHEAFDSTGWMLNINNRYFKSYKHFVGTVEQIERLENGTEVINHTFSTDMFIMKNLNRRWSIGANLPFISNTRSSLYEHGGNAAGPSARHNTHSVGLGDVRLAVYRWIIDPMKFTKFNAQVGLGIKLPTGDYRYQDYFWKNDTTRVLGPVDQSIQLGDGGTGFTLETNLNWNISHTIVAYGNFYYLSNPREQNGVSTARGGTPSATSILYRSDVMSVPDQWMIRAGLSYMYKRTTASIGVRREAIPSKDLIGGSNGFRRPGFVFSVEPGLVYMLKKANLFFYLPVALERNRT
ncbi:MAG: hypothetical protein ACO29O_05275, partial [Chitinophagaceae bacterium]